MGSHLDETSHVISLGEFEKARKKYMAQVWQEIKPDVCAMLNSNGGRMVINFENDGKPIAVDGSLSSKILSVIRILEQHMIPIFGQSQTLSKIDFSYDKDNIFISIKKADSLITANYNLNLPSQTQVLEISSLESLENIKNNIIGREAIPNPVVLGSHCQLFRKDKNCGFHESKICQFKNIKAISSKRTTLADRITCKGNKLKCYVVAFANHRGGHVYYGITDEGVVVGEFIQNEKDMKEIMKKVENVMNKIVWPEQIQPKRGELWKIFFEPVKDANSKPVPSTFVVVIYIAPCLGGVFTEEPECYEMVEGEVKKISFATWKKRISQPAWLQKSPKKNNIPNSVQGITWSSDAVRKAFTVDCDILRKTVSNGNWEIFRKECNSLQNESDLRETMNLLILFKHITACNRRGEFQNAHKSLEEYKALSSKVQDSFIFEVLGLYLEAALKRASGDLKALKELLKKALSMAERIEPGLVTATVYIFAATVSDLINLESPDALTKKALEHLQCVTDSSDVLAAMRRKANIILATFHLGCNVSGQLIKNTIDIASLENAKTRIKAISESAYEEHPLSVYFEIQFNLVLSIYKYRHSQLYPDQRNHYLRNACSFTQKAKSLAVKYGFTEMVEWSEKNAALCAQELVNNSDHVRNDESDQKSRERTNQHERSSRGDCVEQCERNDHQKNTKERRYPRNSAEQVGLQDGKEKDNHLESKSLTSIEPQKENDGRKASTFHPRNIAEQAKSQNPDDLNVKRNSQVKPDNEEALLSADLELKSNTVQGSKAQDSSDKRSLPQRDSLSPSGKQKQLKKPPRQSDITRLVSDKPFQPRTSSPSRTANHQIHPSVACVMSNARMPMYVVGASAFKANVSYSGILPIASQRFSGSRFSFHQFPKGTYQAQVPAQGLRPSTYPFESTHRAQAPSYPAATGVAYQPRVFANHPELMMIRPLMAAGRGAHLPYGMQAEPIQTSPCQGFSLQQQMPASQLQQQQQKMYGNPPRLFPVDDRRIQNQRQHKHRRKSNEKCSLLRQKKELADTREQKKHSY